MDRALRSTTFSPGGEKVVEQIVHGVHVDQFARPIKTWTYSRTLYWASVPEPLASHDPAAPVVAVRTGGEAVRPVSTERLRISVD